jgi:hypothetical protein
MLRSLLFTAGILALAQAPAPAAETWSWNTANFSVLRTSRWQASIITMGRTGHGLGTPREARTGAIAKFRIAPRFTAVGGYYYYQDGDDARRWHTTQRVFAGMEAPVFQRGRAEVDARVLVERYLPDYKADFTRYRPRVRVSSLRRLGPYAYVESFFVADGLDTLRYSAGVRWLATSRSTVEVGYLYERRRASLGPHRHVIDTHFYFDHFRHKR